ncbi:MAG: hypothetical protein SGJ04_00950 [Bacteroidota bacterium]|nr:hypothetical protein [Bacteroidota bacterium]
MESKTKHHLIITNTTLLCQGHALHNSLVNIYVDAEGVIYNIVPAQSDVIEHSDPEIWSYLDSYVSLGFVDAYVNIGEPGNEENETAFSLSQAALAGGVTHIGVSADNDPITSTSADVKYIQQLFAQTGVSPHVWASISRTKGSDALSDILELSQAGAVGFHTGNTPMCDHSFALKAIEYVNQVYKPLAILARNKQLAGKNLIREGSTSLNLGMRGSPEEAEIIEVNSLCQLAKMLNMPIHFTKVSCAESLDIISKYIKLGCSITADVSIHHLCYTDEYIQDYDTNYKVIPPLGSDNDREELRKALLKYNWLRVISDHKPLGFDDKILEYEYAKHGAIGVQTLFNQLLSIYGVKHLPEIIELLTVRNAKALRIPNRNIEVGANADLVWFNTNENYAFDANRNRSKSRNTPIFGHSFTGRVLGTISRGIVASQNLIQSYK